MNRSEAYDHAVNAFRSLPIQRQYDFVCEVFGKQKVVLQVDNEGSVEILRRPDNVDVVIYNANPEDPDDQVRRCVTCLEHKYATPVKTLCGYSGCGYLCDVCMMRCRVCRVAYCGQHISDHLIQHYT